MSIQIKSTDDTNPMLTGIPEDREEIKATEQENIRTAAALTQLSEKMSGETGLSAEQAVRFSEAALQVQEEYTQLFRTLSALIGNQEKVNRLMAELVQTATETSQRLNEIGDCAVQLIACGTAAENVNLTLRQMNEIAAQAAIPLNEMVTLYNATLQEGCLSADRLNQYVLSGIPLTGQLATQFGILQNEVWQLAENAQIALPDLQTAMQTLATKNTGQQPENPDTGDPAAAQIARVRDIMAETMRQMSETQEKSVSDMIESLSGLIGSYEEAGKAVIGLSEAYDAYQAVLAVLNGLQRADQMLTAQIALEKQLAAMAGITLSDAQAKEAAMNKLLATGKKQLIVIQQSLNRAILSNPYVMAAAAVAALAYGIFKLVTHTSEAEKAQKRLSDAHKNFLAETTKEEIMVNNLFNALKKTAEKSNERAAAIKSINEKYGTYLPNLLSEKSSLDEIEQAHKRINVLLKNQIADKIKNTLIEDTVSESIKKQADSLDSISKRIRKQGKDTGQTASAIQTMKKWTAEYHKMGFGLEDTYGIALKKLQDAGINTSKIYKDVLDYVEEYIRIEKEIGAINEHFSLVKVDIPDIPASAPLSAAEMVASYKNLSRELSRLQNKEQWSAEEAARIASLKSQLQQLATQYNQLSGKNLSEEAALTPSQKPETPKTELPKQQTPETESPEQPGISDQEKYNRELADLEARLAQSEMSNQETGTQHQIKQIQEETERAIKALKEDKKAFEEKFRNADIENFDTSVFDKLIEEQKKRSDNQISSINNQETQDKLRQYKEYATERLALEEKLESNLKKLKEKGASKEEIDIVRQAGEEEIADLDKKYDFDEDSFKKFIDGVITMGIEELQQTITQVKAQLNDLGENGDPSKRAEALASLDTARQQLQNEVDKPKEPDEKDNSKKWGKTVKSLQEIQKATKDVIDCFGDMDELPKELLNTAMSMSSTIIGMISLITSTAWTGEKAVKGVEKASVILAIISMAVQVLMAIVNVFQKFFSKNAALEKQIDASKDRVKKLEQQYDSLGRAIKRALGTDYYQKQIQQAGLMAQKAAELGKQIELTEQKTARTKKKKKQKQEDLDELRQQQEEALAQAQEIRQKVIDELATTDLKSFSKKLADSLIDGYVTGVSDLGALVDKSMDDLMRDMIAKQFDIMVAQQALKPLFSVIEKAVDDFTLTPSEMSDIKRAGENSRDEILRKGELYKQILQDLGLVDPQEKAEQEKESSKGFQAMSQDTGNRLDGIFTMVQIYTASINNTVAGIRETQLRTEPLLGLSSENLSIIATASRLQLEQLVAIEKNTRLIGETNTRLKNIESYTSRL